MAAHKPIFNHPDLGPLSLASWLEISNYTPSQESKEEQDFFGRRRLRIANGQLPVLHPLHFTPVVVADPINFDWPTDEEALAWAEAAKKEAKKKHAKRGLCQLLRETPLEKKQKLSPETAVAAGQQPNVEGAAVAAMPFNLP